MDPEVTTKHPEDKCEKCGGPNIVWFISSALWNEVVRANSEAEILCPVCFVRLAEVTQTRGVWELRLI